MPVRRIPVSRRSHITGCQPFIPGVHSVAHESALERDFVTICRFDPDVIGIEEQPVAITWTDANGRHRRYTPDYRVVKRARTEIVEVKYRDDLWANWANYKPVFAAARDWAERRSMQFCIVTERQIRKPFLANAKRLLPRMQDAVPAEIERHIHGIVLRLQPISLSDLIEAGLAPGRPREVILSALWPLLARKTLVTALDVEISGNSMLSLPGGQP
jgi:hypothetical protein